MVTHAREVLHTTATHEDDRVLLEVVALVRNVGNDLRAIREADLGDLADGRVRLLRRAGHDLHTDAAAEGVTLQRRSLGLRDDFATSLSHELVDGWHVFGWKVGKSGKGAEPTGDEASGKHYFALYVETRISEGKPPEIVASGASLVWLTGL